MFKLVVLSVLLAAAAAEPGVFFTSPLTEYTSVVVPAKTTITKSASSIVYPSPFLYSAPLTYAHFIKKRSPGVLGLDAPPTTAGKNPYLEPLLSTPVVQSPPIVSAVLPVANTSVQLVKKRSAPVVVAPSTYAAAIPLYASTYATAPVISAPLFYSTPLLTSPLKLSTHLIKKRSAPLLTTYVAPSSFSQQSRVDITHGVPALKLASYPTTFYSQPYNY